MAFGAWFAYAVGYPHHHLFLRMSLLMYCKIVCLFVSLWLEECVHSYWCHLYLEAHVHLYSNSLALFWKCQVYKKYNFFFFWIKSGCKIMLIISFCHFLSLSSSSIFLLIRWDIFTCMFELSGMCMCLSACG